MYSRLEQLRRCVEPVINCLNEGFISPRVKLTAHHIDALSGWLTSRTLSHAYGVHQCGTGTLQLALPNLHEREVSQGKGLLSRNAVWDGVNNLPKDAFGLLQEPCPKIAGTFVGTDPGRYPAKSRLGKEECRRVLC